MRSMLIGIGQVWTLYAWIGVAVALAASSASAAAPASPSCLMGAGAPETACLSPDRFRAVDILVLGEVHDNLHHHGLRAVILERFLRQRQGKANVVMEHVRATEVDVLARYQAGLDRTKPDFWKAAAAGLGPALNWDKSGWPKWEVFVPIAEAAFAGGAAIYAGDVARAEIRNIARKGLAALPQARLRMLGLDVDLPPAERNGLLTELEASHCGLMPKSAFGTMADAQRLRDATLAEATVAAARDKGAAVLLTGNGHARDDRGAPRYMRRLAPRLKVATVLFVEASADTAKPGDPTRALRRTADGKVAADAVVLTARVERPDPCVKMRERFQRRR